MSDTPLVLFSSLFPNPEMPQHGIFVAERLRHMVGGSFRACVVAPVPWFPLRARVFGRFARYARVPRFAEVYGVPVQYPRFPALPGIGNSFSPAMMAHASRGAVRRAIGEGARAIDAHYFYPDGAAAIILGREFGLPVVITARGSDINYWPRQAGPRLQILEAAAEAAAVVAVSESLRAAMVELGVPREKIHVVRNGVDRHRFRPLSSISRSGRPTLLMVANLVPEKGHDLALAVLAELPAVQLRLVGDGPQRPALMRLADKLGIAERVTFLGPLAGERLVEEYNEADCLLLTSTREGLPNVVLEAISCGTRVVACDVGGVAEVLTTPALGRVVPNRDPQVLASAVREVLETTSCRSDVRRHAKAYDWSESVASLERLYERILCASPGVAA